MIRKRDSKKPERRDVARTRKAIEDAYHTLILNKEFDKITVTDVINEADISRGTFYAYYKDINDLEEYAEERVLDSFHELIMENTEEKVIRSPEIIVDYIVKDIAEHRKELKALLGHKGGYSLVERIRNTLSEGLSESKRMIAEPERKIIISCVTGAIVESCVDWIKSDKPCNRKVLVETLSGFLASGVGPFVEDTE